MKTLIKNGNIVTPQKSYYSEILIEDEKIKEIIDCYTGDYDRVIDAQAKYILPGIIDAHTHMGIPIMGTWSSDDFESGSIAAAFGGVTTIIDFTVQKKGQSLPDSLRERMKLAEGKSYVDYTFHCNVTDFTETTTSEMESVLDMGVCSFKTFMAYKQAGMMLRDDQLLQVYAKAAALDAIAMLHAENGDLIDFVTDRLISAGKETAKNYPNSRPVESEIEAVHRGIFLAEATGVTLYIVHLTSGGALQLIHQAQKKGLTIIAETCPQYLLFNRDIYEGEEGHCFIASPPFREKSDCDYLWQGIQKGWISTVGTDHCPFTREQKYSGLGKFHTTPNGLPGVETLLTLLYSEGVRKKRLTINKLIEVLCENPARTFKLYPQKGCIREGSDADLVIFDPLKETTLSASTLHSNTDWSPYEGWEVTGAPSHVFLRGQEIVRDEEITTTNLTGKYLSC